MEHRLLSQCDWYPHKKGQFGPRCTHAGRTPWEGKVRDQGDRAEAKEHQGVPAPPETGGRPGADSPSQPQEEPTCGHPHAGLLAPTL